MRSRKNDPNKLQEISGYDITGKLTDFIAVLQKIVDKHPNAVIDYELDYSSCCYESDHPDPKFTIRSSPKHPNT